MPPRQYLEENLAPCMLIAHSKIFVLVVLCIVLRIYVRVALLKTFGVNGKLVAPEFSISC
jgi:hypothetical protein